MAFFSGRPIARKLETASSIRDTPQQKLIKTAGGSVSRSASSETARKSQWHENASRKTKTVTKPTLRQEALAYAGEYGTGISVARGSQVAATSSNSKSARTKETFGTLDKWFNPKTASQNVQTSRSRTTTRNTSESPLRIDRSTSSAKSFVHPGPTDVYVVPDETQNIFDNDSIRVIEHFPPRDVSPPSEPPSALSSDGEEEGPTLPISRSDITNQTVLREKHCSPDLEHEEPLPVAELMIDPASFPPMPTPAPAAPPSDFLVDTHTSSPPTTSPKHTSRTHFGFGTVQSVQKVASSNILKRKRAIIESSSSPTKLLVEASSSSAGSSPPTSKLNACAVTHSTSASVRGLASERSLANAKQKAISGPKPDRTGSRVPWDSDDESEKRRLNRTESEALLQDQLVKKRGAREAPVAIQERTDYMDQYRSESYSPVQYTATEGHMNEFRARLLGLSPRKRTVLSPKRLFAQPTSHAINFARIDVRMDLDEDSEATEVSEPPSQVQPHEGVRPPQYPASYDVTSTFTRPGPASAFLFSRGADDSGFGSSPAGKGMAIPSSSPSRPSDDVDARLLEQLFPEDDVLRTNGGGDHPVPNTSAKHLRASSDVQVLVENEDTTVDLKQNDLKPTADDEDTDAETDESSDFDESTIFRRPRERIILAMPSQETCASDTQFIVAEETQFVHRSPPGEGVDHEDSRAPEPDDLKTDKPLPYSSKSILKSVTHQIREAWNPDLMSAPSRGCASGASQRVQSALTDFYCKKPNGPAERAAAEEQATQHAFAKVALGSRSAIKTVLKACTTTANGDDDESDDDIQEVDDLHLGNFEEGSKPAPYINDVYVEDSEDDEPVAPFGSQLSQSGRPESCEGWVLGKRKSKTPTPVKQYRYRRCR